MIWAHRTLKRERIIACSLLQLILIVGGVSLTGCDRQLDSREVLIERLPAEMLAPNRSARGKVNDELKWKPSDLFDDLEYIAICDKISAGDLQGMQSLLEDIDDLNKTGKSGCTLLYWALVEERLEAFKTLLEYGVDPDIPLTEPLLLERRGYELPAGESVLSVSIRFFRYRFCATAIPFSREPNKKYGDLNLLNLMAIKDDLFGGDPVAVQALIDAGVDVNSPQRFAPNPAFYYIEMRYPRLQIALVLLKAGADPSGKDSEGRDLAELLEWRIWTHLVRYGELPDWHDGPLLELVDWLDQNYRKIRWLPPTTEGEPSAVRSVELPRQAKFNNIGWLTAEPLRPFDTDLAVDLGIEPKANGVALHATMTRSDMRLSPDCPVAAGGSLSISFTIPKMNVNLPGRLGYVGVRDIEGNEQIFLDLNNLTPMDNHIHKLIVSSTGDTISVTLNGKQMLPIVTSDTIPPAAPVYIFFSFSGPSRLIVHNVSPEFPESE